MSKFDWWLAGIAIAFFIIVALLPKKYETSTKLPSFLETLRYLLKDYDPRPLLTETELQLYWKLRRALPQCVILSQIEITRLVQERSKAAYLKIRGMSIDFVVCIEHKQNIHVVAAIELDDRTHDTSKARHRDERKTAALNDAGIKLLRWRAEQLPSEEEIRRVFTE